MGNVWQGPIFYNAATSVFSDHCPIKISLETGYLIEEEMIHTNDFVDLEQTFKWIEVVLWNFHKFFSLKKKRLNFETEIQALIQA